MILRPSILFGPEDGFFNKFAAMARVSPILPLVGGGHTRFQPVFVGDVAQAILALIDKERDGAVVDRGLIRQCVQLFEGMGMGSLDVYTQDFEEKLLAATREFYARKADAWITDDPTPSYLIKAEKALDEERQRVAAYLNSETESKLLKVIDEEVLGKRESALLEKEGSGCRVLLINNMSEDLSRMFRLFSRLPDGLAPMAEIVKQHISEVGACAATATCYYSRRL